MSELSVKTAIARAAELIPVLRERRGLTDEIRQPERRNG